MGYIQNYAYLHIPDLNARKGYRVRELLSARNWLEKQRDIPVELHAVEPSVKAIKAWDEQLLNIAQDSKCDFADRTIAFLCLRCHVSFHLAETIIPDMLKHYPQIPPEELVNTLLGDVVETVLVTLENELFYSRTRGETIERYNPRYIPPAFNILRRWQPEKSNLRTWTRTRVMSQDILKQWDIDRRRPWQILCRTSPRQIKIRLLKDEAVYVFIFREIYLPDLDRKRPNRHAPFPEPTAQEIEQIMLACQTRNIPCRCHPDEFKIYLIELSDRLRKKTDLSSLSGQEKFTTEEPDLSNDLHNSIIDIIEEQFSRILQQAIVFVMEKQLDEHRKKHHNYATHFYQCYYFLYCEGLSQSAIAKQLNLGNQSNVSRITNITLQVERIEQFCVDTIFRLVKVEATYDEDIEADDLIIIKQYIQSTLRYITFAEAHRAIKSRNRNGTNQFAEVFRVYLKGKMGIS